MGYRLSAILIFDVPALSGDAESPVAVNLPQVVLRSREIVDEAGALMVGDLHSSTPLAATFPTVSAAIETAIDLVLGTHDFLAPYYGRAAVHLGEVSDDCEVFAGSDSLLDAIGLKDIAEPGQVLISEVARALLPQDYRAIAHIGSKKLEGRPHKMGVFAAVRQGLPVIDASIPVPAALRTNIPRALTRLIGRAEELSEIKSRFFLSRLVSLVGPGGVGKTRLAMRVADDLLPENPDGAWYIDVAEFGDVRRVEESVATLFKVLDHADVAPADAVASFLQDREALLVFDNCEHLLGGVSDLVVHLAKRCRNLAILVTSRKELRIDGESVVQVKPMTVPFLGERRPEVIEGTDAVQLFLDRAQVRHPSYEPDADELFEIAELCRSLDGIPLALEIAAAQASRVRVSKIRPALGTKEARKGGTTRFKTLDDAINWSIGLIDGEARRCFALISVFVGSFDLEAAIAILASPRLPAEAIPDAINRLVAASLLVATDGGRFRMLEPIKSLARRMCSKLKSAGTLREAHARYYCEFIEKSGSHVVTSSEKIRVFESDMGNLRAGLDWCIASGNGSLGFRYVLALNYHWNIRGLWREGLDYADRLIAVLDDSTSELARLLNLSGALAQGYGDVDRAFSYFERASKAVERHDMPLLRAAIYSNMANAMRFLGRLPEAKELFLIGRAHAQGHPEHQVYWSVESNYGACLADLEPGPEARAILESCVPFFSKEQSVWLLANIQYSLGVSYFGEGDLAAAREHLEAALKLHQDIEAAKGTFMCVRALSAIAFHEGLDHMAAYLAGAAAGIEEWARPSTFEQGRFRFDHVVAGLQARMGSSRFKREFEQGRLASPEDLAARLLREAEPPL